MGWFGKKNEEKWQDMLRKAVGCSNWWMERCVEARAELAAEKAKEKCKWGWKGECTNPKMLRAIVPDPEAARIAALPKCGTTKKCPACGKNTIGERRARNADFATDRELSVEHQYMVFQCTCGHSIYERPLFNSGVKGK